MNDLNHIAAEEMQEDEGRMERLDEIVTNAQKSWHELTGLNDSTVQAINRLMWNDRITGAEHIALRARHG